MNLKKIKPNPKNPRAIRGAAFERLKNSIRRDPEFMALRPIVVDEAGVILGGNQRYRAALSLGMTDVPDSWVVKATDLTEEQRRRFILVDNAPEGMAGEWDFEALANEWDFEELASLGFQFPKQDEEETADKEEPPAIDLSSFSVLLLLSKKTYKKWKKKKMDRSDDEFMNELLGPDEDQEGGDA